MNNNIIFLDIDGVLLSETDHHTIFNQDVLKIVSDLGEKNPDLRPLDKTNLIQDKIRFNETSIALINRLCEKSNAKIVIISNWRRNYGLEKTYEKLINEGIKKEYFHSTYAAKIRGMSSTKENDILAWFESHHLNKKDRLEYVEFNNNSKEYQEYQEKLRLYYNNHGYNYLIIDDTYLQIENQLLINPENGFSSDDYRMAAGFFNVTDTTFSVFPIDEKYNIIFDKFFTHKQGYGNKTNIKKLEFLFHSKSFNNQYQSPRCTSLSEEYAKNSYNSLAFFGFTRKNSFEQFYQEKIDQVLIDFKKLNNDYYPKDLPSCFLFTDEQFCNLTGTALNDFEKHPLIYPCLLIDDVIIYPPNDFVNKLDYLIGYYDAIKKIKTKDI